MSLALCMQLLQCVSVPISMTSALFHVRRRGGGEPRLRRLQQCPCNYEANIPTSRYQRTPVATTYPEARRDGGGCVGYIGGRCGGGGGGGDANDTDMMQWM